LENLILGRYLMSRRREDILGEGTFSVCRKGIDIETGEGVAIKVYKEHGDGDCSDNGALSRFQRTISVLRELQKPFSPPADPALWSEELDHVQASDLFVKLLDFSRDQGGEPGPDPCTGVLYVVTELAQYSLKDFFAAQREAGKPLQSEAVWEIARSICLATAGLHAKGFVHLDLKPSNLMIFDGRLKLIDIDGCVPVGTLVSKSDASISFSPYYCAPEWARFLTQGSAAPISISPSLDVWSAGMTICEVVHLDEVMRPTYTEFTEGSSPQRAVYHFMTWLGRLKSVPFPRSVQEFDTGLHSLLSGKVLACNESQRMTMAQCLNVLSGTDTGRHTAPCTWAFPTQLQGARCHVSELELQFARLQEAARMASKGSMASQTSNAARTGYSKAMKVAKHPMVVLGRQAQSLKAIVGALKVTPDLDAPPLRSAFEEA